MDVVYFWTKYTLMGLIVEINLKIIFGLHKTIFADTAYAGTMVTNCSAESADMSFFSLKNGTKNRWQLLRFFPYFMVLMKLNEVACKPLIHCNLFY